MYQWCACTRTQWSVIVKNWLFIKLRRCSRDFYLSFDSSDIKTNYFIIIHCVQRAKIVHSGHVSSHKNSPAASEAARDVIRGMCCEKFFIVPAEERPEVELLKRRSFRITLGNGDRCGIFEKPLESRFNRLRPLRNRASIKNRIGEIRKRNARNSNDARGKVT